MYVIIEARKTSVIMTWVPPSRCLLSFLIFGLAAKLAQLKFSAAHLAIDLEFPLQNLIKHLLWRGEGRGKALTRLKKQDERKNAANWSRQSCWPRRAQQRVDLKRKAEHTNFKLMAQWMQDVAMVQHTASVPDPCEQQQTQHKAKAGNWRGQHWF